MVEEKTIEIDFSQKSNPTEVKVNESNQNFINGKFMEILQIKKSASLAPINNPKNFFEQFNFFDDGTNVYLYLNINNKWVPFGQASMFILSAGEGTSFPGAASAYSGKEFYRTDLDIKYRSNGTNWIAI